MPKISFIIIGRNQEFTIKRCIESIRVSITKNKITNYEIIYVDSKSEDNTLNIIKNEFNNDVKIVSLTGKISAPIGRNVGVEVSIGNTLFFIDGDMEINSDFLKQVYDEEQGLKYDIVSGKLKDVLYDGNLKKIGEIKDRYNVSSKKNITTIGGVFLIKADIFNKVGCFDERFRINQDLDFGLTLCKNGFEIIRIPTIIAVHHTIDFYNFARLFKRIVKGDKFYSSALFRKHIFNTKAYKSLINREKFTILLILAIILSIGLNPVCFLIYPIIIFMKYLKNRENSFLELFIGRIVDNIMFLVGIFIFYPQKVNKDMVSYYIH